MRLYITIFLVFFVLAYTQVYVKYIYVRGLTFNQNDTDSYDICDILMIFMSSLMIFIIMHNGNGASFPHAFFKNGGRETKIYFGVALYILMLQFIL